MAAVSGQTFARLCHENRCNPMLTTQRFHHESRLCVGTVSVSAKIEALHRAVTNLEEKWQHTRIAYGYRLEQSCSVGYFFDLSKFQSLSKSDHARMRW